jgi:hypothetical protein
MYEFVALSVRTWSIVAFNFANTYGSSQVLLHLFFTTLYTEKHQHQQHSSLSESPGQHVAISGMSDLKRLRIQLYAMLHSFFRHRRNIVALKGMLHCITSSTAAVLCLIFPAHGPILYMLMVIVGMHLFCNYKPESNITFCGGANSPGSRDVSVNFHQNRSSGGGGGNGGENKSRNGSHHSNHNNNNNTDNNGNEHNINNNNNNGGSNEAAGGVANSLRLGNTVNNSAAGIGSATNSPKASTRKMSGVLLNSNKQGGGGGDIGIGIGAAAIAALKQDDVYVSDSDYLSIAAEEYAIASPKRRKSFKFPQRHSSPVAAMGHNTAATAAAAAAAGMGAKKKRVRVEPLDREKRNSLLLANNSVSRYV